jgi:hypothetical protein
LPAAATALPAAALPALPTTASSTAGIVFSGRR